MRDHRQRRISKRFSDIFNSILKIFQLFLWRALKVDLKSPFEWVILYSS